jgi:two-component system response regulator AtoC
MNPAPLKPPSGKTALSREDLRVRLLIVDDEQSIRKLCITVGEALGFICLEADSGESALALLEEQPVHVVLSDMVMPHMSGLEFLEKVKKLLPRTEVALMTGHGSIETAVQAMKLGAYDYITKPFSPLEELRLFLRRMAEKVRLVEENEFLRERIDSETAVHGIVGSSAKIQEVLRVASRLKDTRTAVLISGESGTGKELIARAIHFRGAFANRPFVAVDCGSLVPTLIESELFGYEKGAFTGALKSKQGLFQSADTGSVFLDEIGELPLELQAKLLRVLKKKCVPSAATSASKWTCASSPPPTAISKPRTKPEPSARIFTFASTSSPSTFPPCGSAAATFQCW